MARALLVARPDEGGAFRHVRDLARGLAAAGLEVAVCGPLAHREAELGAAVLEVPMRRQISAGRDLRSVRGLVGAVRRFRPDLIHAHGSKAGVFARCGRPAYPSLPVLCTPHGYPFAGYAAGEAGRRRYRLIERSLSRLATRVICVCEAERRLACSVGPCGRTRVVHNGTPPDPVSSPQAELAALREAGRPVVSTLSGLRPGKGVETLVEAWPGVLGPHPEAVLAIAGEGPERPRIEALVGRLGIGASVRLLGHLDAGEVLSASTAFAFASWAESFPYAILEAMAFGLPIVSTDVGGIAEAVRDGVSGALVAPRDPAALAAAISGLLDDPAAMARMGEAARVEHARAFTVEAMVQGNLAVYRELIRV